MSTGLIMLLLLLQFLQLPTCGGVAQDEYGERVQSLVPPTSAETGCTDEAGNPLGESPQAPGQQSLPPYNNQGREAGRRSGLTAPGTG